LINTPAQIAALDASMHKVFILISTILLAACNFQRSTPGLVTETGSDTPGNQPCSFNWATQPLPDLSVRVLTAMQAAGLTGIGVNAEAYGENCTDTRTNKAVSFTAMETDFHVTAQVKALTDQRQLGDLLERILLVLDKFPAGSTPGPQPGYIGVSFQAGDEGSRLWFPVVDGVSARNQGLHGAALFERLHK
jgi:hypothetical protein